jgi:hypothetical protein
MYQPDPVLGYRMLPGEHHVAIEWKTPLLTLVHNFTVSVNSDGQRITSSNPEKYAGLPEIWLFGCSYTLGWPLEDGQAYPWLVQERLRRHKIRNFAVNGYGNTHALLQLQKDLQQGKKPVIVVFVYNSFFLERNVATSAIAAFAEPGEVNPCYPRAGINDRGDLEIKLLALKELKQPDPDTVYMERVTFRILKSIKELCDQKGILSILAFQYGENGDPVVAHGERLGFKIFDMRLNLSQKDIVYPFDTHPNGKIHGIYAEKMIAFLEPMVGK